MIVFDNYLKIFYSTLINNKKFFCAFGTKNLGDARQIKTIFDFFQKNNIPYKKIVILEQIHSVNIAVFQSSLKDDLEKISEVDGIITQEKEVVLIVRTADCLPIIFIDRKQGIIGISHQGWRGSIKKMSQKMIEKIISIGGRKEDIVVAIGPSIGQCCYDIDEDRYYQFLVEFDGYSDKIFQRRGGRLYLNLSFLNYLLLLEKGIPKNNIDFSPFCTKCDKKRFFSFRRDRKEEYGKMFNFVVKHE